MLKPVELPNVYKASEELPTPSSATPFFKTPYNHDTNAESDRHGLLCPEATRTQQHFKDECDINILFARYLETGEMPQVLNGLSYGDFTGIFDFQTAMNAVRTAEGVFQQLPARIKNRFDNDPQKLLAFLHDPDNREEAEFLGLVNKPGQGENDGTGTGKVDATRAQTTPGSGGTQAGAQPPAATQGTGPQTGQTS